MSDRNDISETGLQEELDERLGDDPVIYTYPSEHHKLLDHFNTFAVVSTNRNRRGPYVLLPGSCASSYWI